MQAVARGNLAPRHLARLYKRDDFSVSLNPIHDVVPSKNSRRVLAHPHEQVTTVLVIFFPLGALHFDPVALA